jgi:hypothetical protein
MITVTFDKNVYELVVEPSKEAAIDSISRAAYYRLNALIRSGIIRPLISETILTYETIRKADRQAVLACRQPLVSHWEGDSLYLQSNPDRHPSMSLFDHYYLPRAIDLGFKVLPDHRLGKLVNTSVQKEWYYQNGVDFLELSKRFGEVDAYLELHGVGYAHFANLIGYKAGTGRFVTQAVVDYSGNFKAFSAALSERSDGDSVALHIAYQSDFFCTNDRGISAGQSVFKKDIVVELEKRYNFRKRNPMELLTILEMTIKTHIRPYAPIAVITKVSLKKD